MLHLMKPGYSWQYLILPLAESGSQEYHFVWLQQEMNTIFNNLYFFTGLADDMIIWDEETDESDHD